MKNLRVSQWFEELQRIWLEKDISAIKNILADEFKYYEDPFLPPLETWSEVESAWQEVKDQNIRRLEISTLIDSEMVGAGSYDFAFEDPFGVLQELQGACYVKLNADGRAVEFRQWWTTK